MDVAFGDFSLHERQELFEETTNSIEFIWQDGLDEKAGDGGRVRSRKQGKQRSVPTTSAVQFSENCLKQEENGGNVDNEIIFQSPLPATAAVAAVVAENITSTDSSSLILLEKDTEFSENEESSSMLNVAAPEFVPVSTSPAHLENVENNDVETMGPSQTAHHTQKYRNYKHHGYQPSSFAMMPDYQMVRGGIPPHLPLPYPYVMPPRHSREPLIPFTMPVGYPYPSFPFQPGLPIRQHSLNFAAGMSPEFYNVEPLQSEMMHDRMYQWGEAPEQQVPETENEVQEVSEGKDAIDSTPPQAGNTSVVQQAANPTAQQTTDQITPQPLTESIEPQLTDSTGENSNNNKEDFNEDVLPIKDNSTGQVVDTGYIHKHVEEKQDSQLPVSKTAQEEPSSEEKLEEPLASEASEIVHPNSTVGSENDDCAETVPVAVVDNEEEQRQTTVAAAATSHEDNSILEIVQLATLETENSSSKQQLVTAEENKPSTTAKYKPSATVGNKSTDSKTKSTEQSTQAHKVDRKANTRTSSKFSSSKETTQTLSDTSSPKMNSKGSLKSGANIILRSGAEKKPHQSSNEPSTASNGKDLSSSNSNNDSNSSLSDVSKSQSVPAVPAWGQGKKWSQLFTVSAATSSSIVNSKDIHKQRDSSSPPEAVLEQAPISQNPEKVNQQLKHLGEQLKAIVVDHKPQRPFLPRGLINRGNMCYVHTTLQVLLSCPSMYNLFSSLNQFPVLSKEPSATPLTDCMIQFTNEFSMSEADSEANQKLNRKKKGSSRDLAKGTPFQPDYVYAVLHKMHSSLTAKGKQEDAEEFLGSILDGLHEEIVNAKKAATPPEEDDGSSVGEASSSSNIAVSDEADEWEEVGHKNKSTITRVVSSFAESHITEIFGGKMRSAVHHQGAKESATVQPFFTLPLDIQASDVMCVEDALVKLAVKEPLHGFTCSKTLTEVEAFKRITLSQLPAVLILHFKRFLFNHTGGSQKLSKEIGYPMELEIPKELLAPALVKGKSKTYKLTGVIYHHGKYAAGGHYTCDVYHPSCGGWIRLDDSIIKPVSDDQVTKHYKERIAYLLFYQKSDLPSNR